MVLTTKKSPGLQLSETSRCRVTWYYGDGDALTARPGAGGKVVFLGRNEHSNELQGPAVQAVRTSKSVSGGPGSFEVILKVPKNISYDLLTAMQDDDWIDISFMRFTREWHTMRGIVVSIEEVQDASTSATSKTVRITGMEWSYIFYLTPLFFNLFTGDVWSLGTAFLMEMYKSFGGSPDRMIRMILRGFTQTVLRSDVKASATLINANYPYPGADPQRPTQVIKSDQSNVSDGRLLNGADIDTSQFGGAAAASAPVPNLTPPSIQQILVALPVQNLVSRMYEREADVQWRIPALMPTPKLGVSEFAPINPPVSPVKVPDPALPELGETMEGVPDGVPPRPVAIERNKAFATRDPFSQEEALEEAIEESGVEDTAQGQSKVFRINPPDSSPILANPKSTTDKSAVDKDLYSDFGFSDVFTIWTDDFRSTVQPQRMAAVLPEYFQPDNQSVWSMAEAWSDPALGELYCDLMPLDENYKPGAQTLKDGTTVITEADVSPLDPAVRYPNVEGGIGEDSTPGSQHMTVIFRDRMFPDSVSTDGNMARHPWFTRLRTYEITVRDIIASQLAKTGEVRRNAFFVGSRIVEAMTQSVLEWQAPLWSTPDVLIHGVRRMEVDTDYVAREQDLFTLGKEYRERVMEHNVLNPHFVSGTIVLGHGRPDIRVGQKLRVREVEPKKSDRTFYIEGVSHDWNYQSGVRTSIVVSRGFAGTDNELQNAISQVSAEFATPFADLGTMSFDKINPGDPIVEQLRAQAPTRLTEDIMASYNSLFPRFIDFTEDEIAEYISTHPQNTSGIYNPYNDPLRNKIQYPPHSLKLRDLLYVAIANVFGPSSSKLSWAEPKPITGEGWYYHEVIRIESGGFVGVPNYLYWRPGAKHVNQERDYLVWRQIRQELITGERWSSPGALSQPTHKYTSSVYTVHTSKDPAKDSFGLPSSAIGLGQLIKGNQNFYMASLLAPISDPNNGSHAIGDPLVEMQAHVSYLVDRHGLPSNAYKSLKSEIKSQ